MCQETLLNRHLFNQRSHYNVFDPDLASQLVCEKIYLNWDRTKGVRLVSELWIWKIATASLEFWLFLTQIQIYRKVWSPTKTGEKDKVCWLKWENETKTPHQLWLSVSDSSFDFVVMKPISQSWPSQSQSPYHIHRPGAKSWRPKVARIANAVRSGQNGHSCLQFSRCI